MLQSCAIFRKNRSHLGIKNTPPHGRLITGSFHSHTGKHRRPLSSSCDRLEFLAGLSTCVYTFDGEAPRNTRTGDAEVMADLGGDNNLGCLWDETERLFDSINKYAVTLRTV